MFYVPFGGDRFVKGAPGFLGGVLDFDLGEFEVDVIGGEAGIEVCGRMIVGADDIGERPFEVFLLLYAGISYGHGCGRVMDVAGAGKKQLGGGFVVFHGEMEILHVYYSGSLGFGGFRLVFAPTEGLQFDLA